jgi:hypothetical protein
MGRAVFNYICGPPKGGNRYDSRKENREFSMSRDDSKKPVLYSTYRVGLYQLIDSGLFAVPLCDKTGPALFLFPGISEVVFFHRMYVPCVGSHFYVESARA